MPRFFSWLHQAPLLNVGMGFSTHRNPRELRVSRISKVHTFFAIRNSRKPDKNKYKILKARYSTCKTESALQVSRVSSIFKAVAHFGETRRSENRKRLLKIN